MVISNTAVADGGPVTVIIIVINIHHQMNLLPKLTRKLQY